MKARKRKPAVFLDRDGTILQVRGYLGRVRLRYFPGAFAALRRLQQRGFPLVIVTNQSGIGRGFFSATTLKKIHRKMVSDFRKRGVRFAGIYFCPHLPTKGCRCRKPRPGMPEKAARKLKLDLRASYVIGDQLRDMQLAKNMKGKGILVLTGDGWNTRKAAARLGVKVTRNLKTASEYILKDHGVDGG